MHERRAVRQVMLVEEINTHKMFAIKVLKKEFIVENDEVDRSDMPEARAAAGRAHTVLTRRTPCRRVAVSVPLP